MTGPEPGSIIHEGLHTITGTIGDDVKKKTCKNYYQVLVRRCASLKAHEKDTTIKCSKNYVWGSNCTVICGKEKESIGSTQLQCMDDLTWSNPMPKCKGNNNNNNNLPLM